jgi:hypothetical protein
MNAQRLVQSHVTNDRQGDRRMIIPYDGSAFMSSKRSLVPGEGKVSIYVDRTP